MEQQNMNCQLYQIHTGFYDSKDVSKGFYEGHTNLFVCAKDVSDARKKEYFEKPSETKKKKLFAAKKRMNKKVRKPRY